MNRTLKRATRRALQIAAIVALVAASTCCGAEYFVDSLDGDDANDGLSPQTAWRSLERVNAAPVGGGDVVRFRRGRVWRGTLTARSGRRDAPLRYAAYGEGAKPRVMSSADLSAPELWTPSADGKIWSTPADEFVEVASAPSPELETFGQGRWFVYCEESARASCAPQTFEDLSDARGFSVEVASSSDKASHLQLTTEGFPVRAGKIVALRFRVRSSAPIALEPNRASLMMRGKPWSSYGETISRACELDDDWRVVDFVFRTTVDAQDGRLTFFLGGLIPENVRLDFVPLGAREVEWRSLGLGADVGNLVLTDRAVAPRVDRPETKSFAPTWERRERAGFKKWTLDDVQAVGDFWYDVDARRVHMRSDGNPGLQYGSIEAPLRGHCCVCRGADVVFEGLAFTHTGAHGISVVKGERVVVRDCVFDWIGGGDLYGGGSGRRVRFGNGVEFWDGSIDCVVERCRFSRIYDVATTTQGSGIDVSRNLVIRDNVIFRCEQAFEIWFDSPETVVEGLIFERNLCVDCGMEWSHVQRPNKIATAILGYQLKAKTVDVTIRNNVFCGTAQYFIKCWHDRIGEYSIDGNVYWSTAEPGAPTPQEVGKFFQYDVFHGGVEKTFEEYRLETGSDAHARWLAPRFRDAAKDDYELLNRDELAAGPSPRKD